MTYDDDKGGSVPRKVGLRVPLRVLLVLLPVLCLLLAWAGWKILKSPYEPKGATSTASAFIQDIHQENWQRAHDLTFKNGYTGRNLDELRRVAARQFCGRVSVLKSWHPPQTHGNRLRRWLNGVALDQDQVWVEFDDAASGCMMTFEMRLGKDSQWKVFNFQSHAG
ncbi:MAG: hypothetical protein ACN6PV_28070 [Achromobacter sp.]|uniref:hypothetical protein n=1 Tax=Achromobacter sp. TaxID=134375 RepID=UPI003D04E02F